jgi:hypothetical protein
MLMLVHGPVYFLLPIHHLEIRIPSREKGQPLSPSLLRLLVKIGTQLLTPLYLVVATLKGTI